jgi:hypothetical protein
MSLRIKNFSEEIFRFSVVRNPQTISSDKSRDTVVKIVTDDAGEEYKYFTELRTLRKDYSRDKFIAEARRLINAPEFADSLKNLKTPIWRFVELLQALPELSVSNASDLIGKAFHQNASDLYVNQAFSADEVVISDSLVLASVIAPSVPGLRTRLMAARRAIAFIQRLASDGEPKKGSERLLVATLLLPTSVFPIPDNNQIRQDENNKAYTHKKALLDEQNTRVQRLLNELSKNNAAADELSGSLSNHLFEQLHVSSDPGQQGSSLSVLPAAKVKTLSTATKKLVLEKLKIPEGAVDVPYVVGQIDHANLKLGKELTTKFDDLLIDGGTFSLSTCGECKTVILPDHLRKHSKR